MYMQVVTWVFLIVGVLHLYRAFKGYAAVVGSLHIKPEWSYLGAALALYLAYQGYKLNK
jgi:hypothetical protein